ncbi:oxidoreductase [Streptomyces sp. TS71-3]|uniref:oxidoreductase n=1 Tax=Streptomyces sp. TS71-3 TaxID=2733862 RepID=UPI001B124A88|nr:oxidoreductase [Streptomyces sp. TS71-3]GHJ42523.1 oxidoreductase [Streptomyces sp. TS71-3]
MLPSVPGGTLTPAPGLTLSRMGYGAMRLTSSRASGPPKDRTEALAVLREAVDLGVTHIDTADFYGPVTVNELIREALAPYPEGLCIATKVGVRQDTDGGWHSALEPDDLKAQVRENLRHLGLDALDLCYLRTGSFETIGEGRIAEQFGALAELRREGLVRHLGLSGVSPAQLSEAQSIAPVVAVQNLYNLGNRQDDPLVDRCAAENIAYAAYFPLGGLTPAQSEILLDVSADLGVTPQQTALAWLLRRSPTTVLIPGTSSVAHLRLNIAAADVRLPADVVAELDAVGT